MATGLSVDFPQTVADAILRDRIERCCPAAIGAAIREDLVNEVSSHVAALDARANRLGGARTHFYEHEAESVTWELGETELRISVGEIGLRQRFLGGALVPGPGKKWITIPARAEAHGKRAGEFNNLRFVQYSEDTAALIVNEGGEIGRRRVRGSKGFVNRKSAVQADMTMFWLKKSVTQEADASVLPSAARLAEVALLGAKNYVGGTFPNS